MNENGMVLYIMNDEDCYLSNYHPYIKCLLKHYNKGRYDSNKAIKGFERIVYNCNRIIKKRYDESYSLDERKKVARILENDFITNIDEWL